MASTYRPDRQGMKALMRSDGIGRACERAAQAGQRAAEAAAPRDSGEYATSFRTRRETVTVSGEQRAGAVLENTAPHAAAVEWRNGAHVLSRAVDAIEGA